MNIGDSVKFTKVLSNLEKEHPEALPVDYKNEGVLLSDIEPNNPIIMARSKRNGIEVSGIFQTSPIKKIEGSLIYTQNSVWEIEVVEGAK